MHNHDLRNERSILHDPYLKAANSDQGQIRSAVPIKTNKKSLTDAEKLTVASGNCLAALKEEAKATRELYEKKVAPEESWEKIIARLRSKAQEVSRAPH